MTPNIFTILICLSSLVLSMPYAHAEDIIDHSPFTGEISANTNLVSIRISGITIKVPRNYLSSLSCANNSATFIAEFSFPDLKGAMDSNKMDFLPHTLYRHQNIIMVSRANNLASSYQQNTKEILQRVKLEGGVKTPMGLVKLENPFGGDLYVHEADPPEKSVVINCIQIIKGTVRCRSLTDIAPGFVVETEYDYSLLPRWMEIHQGLLSLVKSFSEP